MPPSDISKELMDKIHEKRSARTVDKYKDKWVDNVKANIPRIKNQACDLWIDTAREEAILVAAGPSLTADLESLKQKAKRREVICADAAFRFCVKNGITPDYVVCTDSSKKILQMIKGLEQYHTKLIANVIMDPEVIEAWKGEIYWFVMANDIKHDGIGKTMQDIHCLESKVGTKIVPGGNVSSIMLGFALSIRNATKITLYGHDFCWKEDFYCGGEMQELANERIRVEGQAQTIFKEDNTRGEVVVTNLSLKQFSTWHEDATKNVRPRIDNKTSSTILRI